MCINESRLVWKPMHMQPAFERFDVVGGSVSARLFERGICLPSGSTLTRPDVERIAGIVRGCGHPSDGKRRVPAL